jgi:serine/threonine protein kinase
MHNGSLDSFHEDKMSVGLSTVPNQFCSAREAIELRKLLLLSNGSRGGIVPSSTAVMDMYMVGKVIGVGSYGKVRAAWHRLTGCKVAIKTYDKSKLKDPAHWKRVHSEIKITEQVSHARIARMYEAVETPKRMHLIMECLDGGNLCSYVKAKRRLSEDEAKGIFFQLLQAIDHLHQMRVTHRDVKLENVLFDTNESKDIKLIDFGFSTVCEPGQKLKVFCGTPSYMAPEIVRRTEYEGKPVDMWSMGILLYALLCGCFPFRAKSYPDLYRRIARGTFAMPEELSVSVRDLIRQLLNIDASRRMTSAAAMRHPWLQVQVAQAPDMAKLRLTTPILISDRPDDDVDDETLDQLNKFGLSRDEILRQVMSKTHSALATLYYLLLNVVVQKRRLANKSRSSSGPSKSKTGSSSSRPQSGNAVSHGQRQEIVSQRYFQGQQGSSNGGSGSGSGHGGQQVQQQPVQVAQGLGAGMARPRSASATRTHSSGARPLATYTHRPTE